MMNDVTLGTVGLSIAMLTMGLVALLPAANAGTSADMDFYNEIVYIGGASAQARGFHGIDGATLQGEGILAVEGGSGGSCSMTILNPECRTDGSTGPVPDGECVTGSATTIATLGTAGSSRDEEEFCAPDDGGSGNPVGDLLEEIPSCPVPDAGCLSEAANSAATDVVCKLTCP